MPIVSAGGMGIRVMHGSEFSVSGVGPESPRAGGPTLSSHGRTDPASDVETSVDLQIRFGQVSGPNAAAVLIFPQSTRTDRVRVGPGTVAAAAVEKNFNRLTDS